mgnify:CR=1 FL=1
MVVVFPFKLFVNITFGIEEYDFEDPVNNLFG